MFRHPDTGQCLPAPSQQITFTTNPLPNPLVLNNTMENTNKPSLTPFVFREGPTNPNPPSFICQRPMNSDFNSSMNNLSIKREDEKKGKEKEKEKDAIIENLFAELTQMRTQIQTLSSAVDKMFTIVSKITHPF